jgi:hypothetical protein
MGLNFIVDISSRCLAVARDEKALVGYTLDRGNDWGTATIRAKLFIASSYNNNIRKLQRIFQRSEIHTPNQLLHGPAPHRFRISNAIRA